MYVNDYCLHVQAPAAFATAGAQADSVNLLIAQGTVLAAFPAGNSITATWLTNLLSYPFSAGGRILCCLSSDLRCHKEGTA